MKILGRYYVTPLKGRMKGLAYHRDANCRQLSQRTIAEQEVWVDEAGDTFLRYQPTSDQDYTAQLVGGRWIRLGATHPCAECGDSPLETILASRGEWEKKGRCYATAEPGFFEFRGHSNQNSPGMDRALAMCNGAEGVAPCPVREECRTYGRALHLATAGAYGIFGGETHYTRGEELGTPRLSA